MNQRNKYLMETYGITENDYLRILEDEQGGVCAICKKKYVKGTRRMHVDHQHVKGFNKLPPEEKRKYIRGIICWTCNMTLGYAKDNIQTLLSASKYLEKYQTSQKEKK